MGKMYPVVTEEYRMALEAAKPKLKAFLIESGCAPLMLRLAYVSIVLILLTSTTLLLCTVEVTGGPIVPFHPRRP
ncbi:hypothetical protein Tco_1286462, partial [Tanacetum coccineum]